jgi:hypothetical protein
LLKDKIDEIKILEEKLVQEKIKSDEMARCLSKFVVENLKTK